jgi:hypothetical protein
MKRHRFVLTHKGERIGSAKTEFNARKIAHMKSAENGWKVQIHDHAREGNPVVFTWFPMPDLQLIMLLWRDGINHYNPLIN